MFPLFLHRPGLTGRPFASEREGKAPACRSAVQVLECGDMFPLFLRRSGLNERPLASEREGKAPACRSAVQVLDCGDKFPPFLRRPWLNGRPFASGRKGKAPACRRSIKSRVSLSRSLSTAFPLHATVAPSFSFRSAINLPRSNPVPGRIERGQKVVQRPLFGSWP